MAVATEPPMARMEPRTEVTRPMAEGSQTRATAVWVRFSM